METSDLESIVADISFLAEQKDDRLIRNILVGSHPSDIARVLQGLGSPEQARYVFSLLKPEIASDVLVELDDVTKEILLEKLKDERLSEIVDEMDSDDATDLVAELPNALAEKILDSIDREDSEEVRKLLRHEEDTAGGIMALEYVAVSDNVTVDEAIKEIRAKAEEVEQVYNVYVVDETGKLVGFLPLKRLILARTNAKIRSVMKEDFICVPVDMDQEAVANIFRQYNLVSVPVADEAGKFVGVITVDDIVEVMEEEASEDLHRMAGIADEEELRETSVLKISFGRLPWLMVGFGGQLVAAFVLKQFEASLKEIFIATFFIPLMMAMGGNAGIQAATIVVRSMALGAINQSETFRRLAREVKVSLLNGTVCGVLLFAVITLIDQPHFAIVLALSMIAVILNASIIGAGIPVILRRLEIDPAIATGPLITTFNDIIGLSIYLGAITAAVKFIE